MHQQRSAPLLKRGKHPTQMGESRKGFLEERPLLTLKDQTMSRAKSSGGGRVEQDLRGGASALTWRSRRSWVWLVSWPESEGSAERIHKAGPPGPAAPLPQTEEQLRNADQGHRHTNGTLQGLNSGLASAAQGSEGNHQSLRHQVFTLSTYVTNGTG